MKKLRLAFYVITFLSWVIPLSCIAQTSTIDSLLLALAKTDTHKEKVVILNHLGDSYKKIDSKRGLAYVQQAVKLADKHLLKELKAESLVTLGRLYTIRKKYKNAEESFVEAIELGNTHKFSQPLAKAFLGMGILKSRQEEFTKSIEYLNKALKYKMSLIDQADVYYYLGSAKQMTNKSKEGLLYYKKSLKIYKAKQLVDKQC